MAKSSEDGFDLIVVSPVYNEEGCIEDVVNEWLPPLRQLNVRFRILLLNDGSTDGTPGLLEELSRQHEEIVVESAPNKGHGKTCVAGYKQAIASGAAWVLQLDSDGQCDPCYIKAFWDARQPGVCVQGSRVTRDDGALRLLATQNLLPLLVFLCSGSFVRDLNVPYRLMDRQSLHEAVALIPDDFVMTNILLSCIFAKRFQIRWVDIHFRRRAAGISKYNFARMLSMVCQFIGQFMAVRKTI